MSLDAETMLLKCLYCDDARFEMGQGSLEHAILSSLGGRKSSRNVCCAPCNTRLGDEVDEAMAKNFSFISANIGLVTGRNKPAAALRSIVEIEGQAIDMCSGGVFKLSKGTVKIEVLPDGRSAISVNANTVEEAENLRDQVLRKYSSDEYHVEHTEMMAISTPVPILRSTVGHAQLELRRAAAKMALAYFATMVDPRRLRTEAFAPIVSFIRGTGSEPEGISGVEQLEVARPVIKSAFTHSLVIAADSTSRRVIALLRLFGAFGYTVQLSDQWDGPNIGRRYDVDPVHGESSELDVDVDVTMGSFNPDKACNLDDFNLGVERLMEAIVSQQQRNLVEEICIDVLGDNPSENFSTEEAQRRAVDEIMERLLPSLLRQPNKRLLPVPHRSGESSHSK